MNLNTERQVFDYGIYKNHTGRGKVSDGYKRRYTDHRCTQSGGIRRRAHAVNIPNPSITNRDIPELPDKNQELLVYCRSGQRSKIAAKKLDILGYQNIKDFGGILDWKYEVE